MEHTAPPLTTFTAFAGYDLVAAGTIESVLPAAKARHDAGAHETTGARDTVLIFDDATGKQIDFDFEGTAEEVMKKLAFHPLFAGREALMTPRTGPGRPRLGVVSREISLLPRHWEWLEGQPQGASAALRRLVDEARRKEPRDKRGREAAGTFLWALAGNLPDFEEATRALYAGDRTALDARMAAWPAAVRDYVRRLLDGV